jgi:hypothetical protein
MELLRRRPALFADVAPLPTSTPIVTPTLAWTLMPTPAPSLSPTAVRHNHCNALHSRCIFLVRNVCRNTQDCRDAHASLRRCASLRWQVPPSSLLTFAPFMQAASPTLALTAVARTGVPTAVPTQVRLSEPSRAAEQ